MCDEGIEFEEEPESESESESAKILFRKNAEEGRRSSSERPARQAGRGAKEEEGEVELELEEESEWYGTILRKIMGEEDFSPMMGVYAEEFEGDTELEEESECDGESGFLRQLERGGL
jgi:hypothetical protein